MAKNKNQKSESSLPKLAAPAQRALASVGIKKLEDLTKFTERELMQLHGMGPNAMSSIRLALKTKEISFKKKD